MTAAEYFTQPEAAQYLRIGETAIKAAVRAGKLPKLKYGKSVRYRRCDLDAWAATNVVKLSGFPQSPSDSNQNQVVEKTVSAR